MKCIEENFKGCLCADCVYNPYYCTNTSMPCPMADCDLCETAFSCDEIFCFECNCHLTIEQIDEIAKTLYHNEAS